MYDNKDINDILKEIERKNPNVPIKEPEPEETENVSPEPDVESAEANDVPETAAEPVQTVPEPDHKVEEPVQPYQQYPRPDQRAAAPYGYRPDGRPVNRNMNGKKKKKKRKRSSRIPGVLFLITLIFGTSIVLSMVIIAYGKDMLGIGKSENTQMIYIDEGATTEEVSLMLKEEGIIKSPKAFQMFSKLRRTDKGYLTGEHFVRPNMAYETIITELTQEKAAQRGESIEITFTEGIDMFTAARMLEEEGICNSSDFIFYFNAGGFGLDFEKMLPAESSMKFKKMEGYLFPDTYIFYQNSEPEEVCQKIYYNFDTKLTDERIARMKELNLTLDQLVTFASIVQKEAGSVEDMADVASVFWNRMENPDVQGTGGKLESDPTKYYADDVIRPNMDYYDASILDAYDTKKTVGLPPGAIGNPGIDAIDAVLEHKSTNYYFFYANIYTKYTRFAETYDEHQNNEQIIRQEIEEYKAEQERLAAEAAAAAENE